MNSSTPDGVVVHTALGDYAGAIQDGVAVFKGIPYAEPPFGALRFQAPKPVGPHEGIRACLAFGATAPKPPYPAPVDAILSEPVVDGDDCLNLNIWTPAPTTPTTPTGPDGASPSSVRTPAPTGSDGASPSTGLPVLVWVHGGAFANGSGGVSAYDGRRFARDGVVCVTINYRLGVDGFLLLDGVPANRGLLDQVAALEWVRDNIAAFGGDPAKVTVAGESAGAMSISTLLAMPRAAGLFRQAITQSGAAAHVIAASTSRRVTAGLAEALGIEPTAEAFAAVDLDVLTAGQARFSAALAVDRDPAKWAELVLNAMPFEPTVDGDVLTGPPLELIRAGAGAGVRLLTGTNRDEMSLFLAPSGLLEHADDAVLEMTAGFHGLPVAGVDVYRRSRPEATPGQLINDIVTDWFFRLPAIRVVEARAEAAAKAVEPEPGPAPSYVYEFVWPTPQWNGALGATHALEVPFVFDVLDDPASEPLVGPSPPQSLADEMHGAWVAFVATGEPGWPAYADDRVVMSFGEAAGGSGPVLDPRSQARQVWTGIR